MTGTTKVSARCECGAVDLHAKGAPVMQLVCHCSDCRDFSGMPCLEIAFFQPDECSVHGKFNSTTMSGGTGFDKTHYSCAICKTPLYVTIAALNGACAVIANRLSPFNFEPQAHIWTSEKFDDVTIPAGVTQSSEAPPKEIVDIMVSSFWGTN
jgi:hypothetical protein